MAASAKSLQLPPSDLAVQQDHYLCPGDVGRGDSAELPLPSRSLMPGEVGENADLFRQFMALDKELSMLECEEEDLRVEIANLLSVVRLMEAVHDSHYETKCGGALIVGRVVEVLDEGRHAVVTTSVRPFAFCVPVLGDVDRALLKPSANVALSRSTLAVVQVLPADSGWTVPLVKATERPSVTYADVVGCDEQKRELLEAVELPLTHPELFARAGLDAPRGVLLHGPPGTGKTMLAKAVAHHTSAAFIRVSGSEFVNTHSGEGPRMVREVFQAARENAPAIIFFDEVDAIAAARTDSDDASAADREVYRVLLELLAQMDGFDQCPDVRVIMATNRPEALDSALLRPGRVDRRVEFPLPGRAQKRRLFQACTAKMSLDGGVDLEDLVARHEEMSAADIDAVCREAGMRAVRDRRCVVTREDFEEGYHAVAKHIDRGADQFAFYSL
ncbi:26S proteasome regulatory subunit 6B homolog [Hordeum vulgare subsp. vulgare]|uniref:AAA+ ATPase domain-containing protein n=1 Tax=Hordeum vulgare subsp. vulgare TaxID=112509 RepID=A0A8I6WI93_HORVV|nr:26S proteasome regulatory subunit 6B homolog [Hordeum vulgare subsp. vulgare]